MNKSKFSAVTTFNLNKHPYGVEMINSFFANWPNEVTLTAFIENSSEIDDSAVNLKLLSEISIKVFQSIKSLLKNLRKKKNILMTFVLMCLDLRTKYMLLQLH